MTKLFSKVILGQILGVILGVFSLTNQALGWGAKGHVLITAYAYHHLNNQQREQLDHYAELLLNKLDDLQQLQLADMYLGMPVISKLSFLPDRYKDMSLKNLFIFFHTPLPKNFEKFQYSSTAKWHYIDFSYPNRPHCELAKRINLINALTLLEETWDTIPKNKDYDKTRALILLLIIHLFEDAHQPLHMYSHTTARCKQDAGGNLRILMNKNHRQWRLHQWWDDSAGFFNKTMPWPLRLGLLNLLTRSTESGQNNNPVTMSAYLELMTEENGKLIPWIYSQPSSRPMSEKYRQQSQLIALSQMRLAGDRLTSWLEKNLNPP
jgi:hypothetical protein